LELMLGDGARIVDILSLFHGTLEGKEPSGLDAGTYTVRMLMTVQLSPDE